MCLKYTDREIKIAKPVPARYDRASEPLCVISGGWRCAPACTAPLYFSCETGIVKAEVLQERDIRVTFQNKRPVWEDTGDSL